MKFEDVCGLVQEELKRARAKFPLFPSDPIHAAAIVVEEAGELQQAALQYTYEGGDAGNMDKEALHTAAMAFRFLMNSDSYTRINIQHYDGGE